MGQDEGDRRERAETAGRLAGRLVNRVGLRLLRLGPVREALRRGAAEAVQEQRDRPRPADG